MVQEKQFGGVGTREDRSTCRRHPGDGFRPYRPFPAISVNFGQVAISKRGVAIFRGLMSTT